jgi:peptidoglycan L-alanyl-D-glutamate endopeptidase CwlK
MPYKLSQNSLTRRAGVDYRLIEICDLALSISIIDFGIPEHGGLRNAMEQNDLFKTGKSVCDGYEKESYHQSGRALDFYAYVDGRASWDEGHLATVAAAFLQAAAMLGYKLQWGGLWKGFRDMPHVQLLEDAT